MITFFKDSFRELKHIVWPTRAETVNYFKIVLITLILFGIYLFIAGSLFQTVIFSLDNLF